MTLIAIIFKVIVFDKEKFTIVTPSIDIYIVRFACALLLHMELIEEVR